MTFYYSLETNLYKSVCLYFSLAISYGVIYLRRGKIRSTTCVIKKLVGIFDSIGVCILGRKSPTLKIFKFEICLTGRVNGLPETSLLCD